mgnify:CR=1 FL=1
MTNIIEKWLLRKSGLLNRRISARNERFDSLLKFTSKLLIKEWMYLSQPADSFSYNFVRIEEGNHRALRIDDLSKLNYAYEKLKEGTNG